MKGKWPTLKGRLSQPLTSELEALEQLEKMVPLTGCGKKRLKKLKNNCNHVWDVSSPIDTLEVCRKCGETQSCDMCL